MQGIETRLNLTNSDKAELSQLCFSFQTIAQSVYQALKKNSILDIQSFAKNRGLTSKQANSVKTQVECWFAQDKAEYEEHIQAQRRLQEEADRLGISVEKVPNKLSFKRLIVPCTFNPKRQKLLEEALRLKLPITVQITEQVTPKGERDLLRGKVSRGCEETAFYVHFAFDLPPKPIQASRHQGVLGVDVNRWGLAWSIVKPDGNIQKDENHQHVKGNIFIDTRRHKSSNQITTQIQETIKILTNLAEYYKVAIAIEDLDFTKARSQSKEKGPGYARMIHKLQHAGIKDAFRSRCRKQGIALHLVSPAWTSLGGFIKYGLQNGFSVDQAASFMIARIALFRKHWEPFEIPELSKKGKPYTEFQRKQIQKRQAERLQSQVLYFSESAYNPSVPVPLTRWILDNSIKNQVSKDEMGSHSSSSELEQGQTEYKSKFGSCIKNKKDVTWRDWSKVLGSDRRKWIEFLMQEEPEKSRTTKATTPLERQSLSSEKSLSLHMKKSNISSEREARKVGRTRVPMR